MSASAVRAYLIAGGQYHDIDYARLSLLTMLGAHPEIRTTCAPDYRYLDDIDDAQFIISYTCNVAPAREDVLRLRLFLERGGRWLALHGTNSILAQDESGRWFAPADTTGFMELLGSQFAAHPPIAPYKVVARKTGDPLISGIGDFDVEGGDELYYMRVFGELDVVMDAVAQAPARGFVERDWPADGRHPVLYRKKVGAGEIVYFTLGHRRGHYDMTSLIDYYPHVEKGAWEIDAYREILRRCIVWAKGDAASFEV